MTTVQPETNLCPSAAIGAYGSQSLDAKEANTLPKAIQSAVLTIDESTLRRVIRFDAGLAFEPKTLLAVLAYCYAREVYSSTSVEALLRRDVIFRELCNDEIPGARLMRRFRCENRESIRLCLLAGLRFLVQRKVEVGVVTKLNEGYLAEEARRRIIMAMFIDNMELEGD